MLRPLPNTTILDGGDSLPAPPAADPIERLAGITAPRAPRILDFDIENRPLSYWFDGRCTAEVTAIAWSWVGSGVVEVETLSGDQDSGARMLARFRDEYLQADIVTGHYVRRHDLPIVNGALIEHGLEPLPPRLAHDTKLDLIGFSDLSKSQEALGAMLGLRAPKVGMSQADWREANRLTAEGVGRTVERVCGDVRQHVELRQALIDRGLLKRPRMWRPGIAIRPLEVVA